MMGDTNSVRPTTLGGSIVNTVPVSHQDSAGGRGWNFRKKKRRPKGEGAPASNETIDQDPDDESDLPGSESAAQDAPAQDKPQVDYLA